jgi:hypothetical protein
LARIFLLKTFVTFLMATPSPVWPLVAALGMSARDTTTVPGGLPDNTICALSQLFGHGVPLVDNEVLIEDLEDLAAAEVGHGRQAVNESVKMKG